MRNFGGSAAAAAAAAAPCRAVKLVRRNGGQVVVWASTRAHGTLGRSFNSGAAGLNNVPQADVHAERESARIGAVLLLGVPGSAGVVCAFLGPARARRERPRVLRDRTWASLPLP
ncbi:hypothetical protein PLESTM_001236000 [Pleodorina starrii]|nr:hypothetical protein PLESTM_001236000 [Pleodorina starrii]